MYRRFWYQGVGHLTEQESLKEDGVHLEKIIIRSVIHRDTLTIRSRSSATIIKHLFARCPVKDLDHLSEIVPTFVLNTISGKSG